MTTTIRQIAGMIGLAALVLPSAALANHGHKAEPICPGPLGCWIWTFQEIEETVYDVEYKEVPKKIRVPYIREIKEPVSCKVCVPISGTSLRDVCEIDYKRDVSEVMVDKCITTQDECGNCSTTQTSEPHVKTCLTRTEVTRQVPVLEWQFVAMEDKFNKTYYVRDWKDEEVVLKVPVLKPRTITRKVWTRVPAPIDCQTCDSCAAAEAAPVEAATPAPAEPEIKPDPTN